MNIITTVLVLTACCYHISADDKVRYDNFKVYRVVPKSNEAVEILRALEESDNVYDFWTEVKGVGHPVDIMVAPHLKYRFSDALAGTGRAVGLEWSSYHTLDEINQWLRDLASTYSQVSLIAAGRSYQGRDILGVKVSFKSGNQDRTVFIESNIHAREWISSAVSTYILNELLTSQDSNVRQIAESHDWIFVPIFNPDGFVYSHTTDRMWRKTRTPYSTCAGADPNRNWGYHFNEGGTSSSPCSETYRGPYAFSELSTNTLSEYIGTVAPQLRAYIAFHSYSQLLLLPYGYSAAHQDNYNDLYSVGVKAASSLAQRYNTRFQVGNIVEVLYVASGGSMDWVKGTFGTPITYTYELRDTGRYGFILPANQIIPSGQETLDSLVTILQEFDKIL
ncbi:hypothetical protein Zmor_007070 [Zophobas morio]|uniref:Peptidase M14 domain-containing protein n=1 Tax=Zophobas morio TaxID=2755281 RepID=A0AA38MP05_9CUCU|nr:hypothetical protein Zmor_007070 [Zophobas morio]